MNMFNSEIIGNEETLISVLNAASLVAVTDVSVLITGESGTGKELLAKGIHQSSRRAKKSFVSINCAALPESLAESELFGHRKGSFTGADSHALGRIRSANGGTVFLDEIGELPLSVQSKLLRFLESGECQPVGEPAAVKVDVRIIAATNRDLRNEVLAGRFRQDLYYRLNVVPFEMPPLRFRRADISLLIKHFNRELAAAHKLSAPVYAKSAVEAMKRYNWPGNVRELRNICERLLVLLPGKVVEVTNLPAEIRGATFQTETANAASELNLTEMERTMIVTALDKSGGNRTHAARILGITRDTLNYRLKKFSLNS